MMFRYWQRMLLTLCLSACGGQDSTETQTLSLAQIDDLPATDTKSQLSQLFTNAAHSINQINNLFDTAISPDEDGVYKFPDLPDYDLAPEKMSVLTLLDSDADKNSYFYGLNVIPGFLYEFTISDANDDGNCYGTALPYNQYFSLAAIVFTPLSRSEDHLESYLWLENNQSDAITAPVTRLYLYIPTPIECREQSGCTYNMYLNFTLRGFTESNVTPATLNCQALSIDAIKVDTQSSFIKGSFSAVSQQLYEDFDVNDDGSLTLFEALVLQQTKRLNYLAIEGVLFQQLLEPTSIIPSTPDNLEPGVEFSYPPIWSSTEYRVEDDIAYIKSTVTESSVTLIRSSIIGLDQATSAFKTLDVASRIYPQTTPPRLIRNTTSTTLYAE